MSFFRVSLAGVQKVDWIQIFLSFFVEYNTKSFVGLKHLDNKHSAHTLSLEDITGKENFYLQKRGLYLSIKTGFTDMFGAVKISVGVANLSM